MPMNFWKRLIVSVASTLSIACAFAGTVVVTPGSLAGYTYFPPAVGGGSGSGGSGENVSTLMRCVKTPTYTDRTLNMALRNWLDLDKPIQVYYKVWGGDGGAGLNGGGGGSSAILVNGAPVVMAAGGNGGASAPQMSGSFSLKKTDIVRFVVGGGGGAGSGPTGGGGGAGYTGGGGGASYLGTLNGSPTTMGGKGGAATPGQGGTLAMGGASGSVFPGTAGMGQNGGVSTYPDGSSAPIGPRDGSNTATCTNYGEMTGSSSYSSRWPALPTSSGSLMIVSATPLYEPRITWAGGGGMLGAGGQPAGVAVAQGNNANCIWQQYASVNVVVSSTQLLPTSQNYVPISCLSPQAGGQGPWLTLCQSSMYQPVTQDFAPSHNLGGAGVTGSLPGQIALMYQAANCEVIPGVGEN